jgi:hypothetical protein
MRPVPKTKESVIEYNATIIHIIDRRVVARVPLGAASPISMSPTFSIYLDEQNNLGPCCLCGEDVDMREDPAEMHGAEKPEWGVEGRGTVTHGTCHAQCGLDAGWEIA